jgi:uncharacterized OB-fold protein
MTAPGLPLRDDVISLDPVGLRGLACSSCARRSFPTRELCPHCGSPTVEHIILSRHGEVTSWTVVHQAPPPLQTPYTLATVDLDDGVRLLGTVSGRVDIGSDVTVELFPLKSVSTGEALWWYRFRATEESQ